MQVLHQKKKVIIYTYRVYKKNKMSALMGL